MATRLDVELYPALLKGQSPKEVFNSAVTAIITDYPDVDKDDFVLLPKGEQNGGRGRVA